MENSDNKATSNMSEADFMAMLGVSSQSGEQEEAWEKKSRERKEDSKEDSELAATLELLGIPDNTAGAMDVAEEAWERKAHHNKDEELHFHVVKSITEEKEDENIAATLALLGIPDNTAGAMDLVEEAWERKSHRVVVEREAAVSPAKVQIPDESAESAMQRALYASDVPPPIPVAATPGGTAKKKIAKGNMSGWATRRMSASLPPPPVAAVPATSTPSPSKSPDLETNEDVIDSARNSVVESSPSATDDKADAKKKSWFSTKSPKAVPSSSSSMSPNTSTRSNDSGETPVESPVADESTKKDKAPKGRRNSLLALFGSSKTLKEDDDNAGASVEVAAAATITPSIQSSPVVASPASPVVVNLNSMSPTPGVIMPYRDRTFSEEDIISGKAAATLLGLTQAAVLAEQSPPAVRTLPSGRQLHTYKSLVLRNFKKDFGDMSKTELEIHLLPEEFEKVFDVTLAEFQELPKWRQKEKKLSVQL